MIKQNIILLFILISLFANAQIAPDKYWVQFTDKDNTPYSVGSPEAYLSQRAIDRRTNQSIAIDEKDLPLDPNYIQQVTQMNGVILLNEIKWFNAITIYAPDSTVIEDIENLSFVYQVKSVQVFDSPKDPGIKPLTKAQKCIGMPECYGLSFNQINMLNGQYLHAEGYKGEGMCIAILDAGFKGVDTLEAFQHLWQEGRILGMRDFVDGDMNVLAHHTHGQYVLSVMAGILPDSAYGTATQASYYLLRTEDTDSEYPIEEDNWVAGAEWADSAGVDILNTSLSYSTFDDSTLNYTYESMDGNSTRITIGANIAASRGLLVVNSAGNSGSSSWHYITAPGDGDSVLAVGAVTPQGVHASFSSWGPTFDGRIKPNVMAQGFQAIGTGYSNSPVAINGTSFSSPIMAGMAACLWQAVPQATNMQVFQAIEESANLFLTPNDSMGHGIPNFEIAFNLLQGIVGLAEYSNYEQVLIYPNPFSDRVNIFGRFPLSDLRSIRVNDASGKSIDIMIERLNPYLFTLNFNSSEINTGLYFLKLESDDHTWLRRMIKIE